MDELFKSIQSILIALALSSLCSSFVDAILSPIINLALKKLNIELDSYNSENGLKFGEFIKAIITFTLVYWAIKLWQRQVDRKEEQEKESQYDKTK